MISSVLFNVLNFQLLKKTKLDAAVSGLDNRAKAPSQPTRAPSSHDTDAGCSSTNNTESRGEQSPRTGTNGLDGATKRCQLVHRHLKKLEVTSKIPVKTVVFWDRATPVSSGCCSCSSHLETMLRLLKYTSICSKTWNGVPSLDIAALPYFNSDFSDYVCCVLHLIPRGCAVGLVVRRVFVCCLSRLHFCREVVTNIVKEIDEVVYVGTKPLGSVHAVAINIYFRRVRWGSLQKTNHNGTLRAIWF